MDSERSHRCSGHTEAANRITLQQVTRNVTLRFDLQQVLSLQPATIAAIRSLHKTQDHPGPPRTTQDYPGLPRTQVTHYAGITTTSQDYPGPRVAYDPELTRTTHRYTEPKATHDRGLPRAQNHLNDLKSSEGLPITRTTQDPERP